MQAARPRTYFWYLRRFLKDLAFRCSLGGVLIIVGGLVVSVGQQQIQNHLSLQIPYIPLRRSLALFV